ncbi:ATP12 family chaperone protein [Taklimakanibacter lacteus]|uniref:ATP12 family chaperone protein n=1 Tax=Taklimakanibacter lacteus TaxID=2268456 RepID=UPI0013C512C3
MTEAPARRFYKTVAIAGTSPPYAVTLDQRSLRTPLKQALDLPTRPLAEAVAAEWEAQAEKIDPQSMPFTKLVNTALDRVASDRARIIREIVQFAGSDLVCYRAEKPQELVERQARGWQPVLDWARGTFGGEFVVTEGIVHIEQPEAALAAMRDYLDGKSPWALTALHNMTTLTGSALISAMACDGGILPAEAWLAAHIDEDWQIEQWGADEEASHRRQYRKREFDTCLRFSALSR